MHLVMEVKVVPLAVLILGKFFACPKQVRTKTRADLVAYVVSRNCERVPMKGCTLEF